MKSLITGLMIALSLVGNSENVEIGSYELIDGQFNNGQYIVNDRYKDYNHIIEINTTPEIEDATISIFINKDTGKMEVIDNR